MRPHRFSAGTLTLLLVATTARAQSGPVPAAAASVSSEGALFLLVPVGARATALGQSGVADGGSSEAVFWNPAGLARLRRSEFAVHHASAIASQNTVLAGYVVTRRLGVIGAAAYLVDFGTQPNQPNPGPPIGRFAIRNVELIGSYATGLSRSVWVGVNYKLIQLRHDCSGDCTNAPTTVGTTHAVDVGIQYGAGPASRLHLGMALQHLGFKLQLRNQAQADPLPTRIQVGGAYRVDLPRPRGVDRPLDARVLVDLRTPWNRLDEPDARVGVDVGVEDLLRVRAGYAFLSSESRGPSIGIGAHVGRLTFDFAQIFFESSNFDQPVYISLRVGL